MAAYEVSLAAENLLTVGGHEITNTMIATVLTSVLLLVFALLVRRKAGVIPSRLQVMFEMIFTFFLDQLTMALGGNEKMARRLVPFITTLFIFIFISNLFILLPLVSAFVMQEGEAHAEFFRTPTTDYSATLAMAIMVIAGSHAIALMVSPLGHIGNFIRVKAFLKIRKPMDIMTAVIELFLGFLEMISELAKIFSLGTRLFGNIFAGEVVIGIVMTLMVWTAYLIPIPFIVLASMAGVVQAFVFALLSMLFMSANIRHASHSH